MRHTIRTAAAAVAAASALAAAALTGAATAPAEAATCAPFTYARTGTIVQSVERGTRTVQRATFRVTVTGRDCGATNIITRITVDPSTWNPSTGITGYRVTGSSGTGGRNFNVLTDRTGRAVVAYEQDHTIRDVDTIRVTVAGQVPYVVDPQGSVTITGRYL